MILFGIRLKNILRSPAYVLLVPEILIDSAKLSWTLSRVFNLHHTCIGEWYYLSLKCDGTGMPVKQLSESSKTSPSDQGLVTYLDWLSAHEARVFLMPELDFGLAILPAKPDLLVESL